MSTKAILAIALILAASNLALAQQQTVEGTWTITRFFRVHLRNGNCVDGDLVKRTDREVIIRLAGSGEISFRNDQIMKVEYVKMKSYNEPAVILPKKTPKPMVTEGAIDKPAAPPDIAPDLTDSDEAAPSSISLETIKKVDQTIMVWKQAVAEERVDLANALISMGPDVAPYLEFLLEKRSKSTPQEQVALALASLAEERFIDLCPKLMKSPGGRLRVAAVMGLSKVTSTRRMPILIDAMDDSDASVWKIATDAVLRAASGDSEKRDIAELIAPRVPASKNKVGLVVALGRIGGRAAHDAIWDLVNGNDDSNRLVGIHGVAVMADPEDGQRVVSLLRDPSEIIKKQVCQTLGKMKYEKAAGDLVLALDDPSEGLQKDARWALAQLTGKDFSDNQAWREWWTNFGSQEERFK